MRETSETFGLHTGKITFKNLKNRRHSWVGHTIRHNEFVVNIDEGTIYGKNAVGTSTTTLKEIRQKHRSGQYYSNENNGLQQWRTEGGVCVFNPPEIPKALQNRAKFNPIVKSC